LHSLKESLLEDRQLKTRHVVETAQGILALYEQQARDGRLTEAEAKRAALDVVRSLRYEQSDYFWINDMEPRMVMHPIKPQLDGKDLSGLEDPTGKRLFVEFVSTVRKDGAGFVSYLWPKPGFEKPQPKVSYVKGFAPWGWVIGSGIYVDDVDQVFWEKATHFALMLTGVAVVLFLGLFVIGRGLSRNIGRAVSVAESIAHGNLDNAVETSTGDETGKLLRALGIMQADLRERAESDKAVGQEVARIIDAAQSGDLTQRIELAGKEGFFRSLGEGINRLLNVVSDTFEDIARVMGAMAQGDLTQKITKEYQGVFASVQDDVNTTIDRLQEIVGQIRESTDMISTGSAEIVNGNNNLSERTEQQASSLEETAASMEELTSTVRNNADNSQQANQLSTDARALAEKGGSVVSEAVQAMEAINTSSNKIAEIIGVIDEIAFQTNLLALNASVEAARAGEQGRGFAVVATEVRNLAQRSATAAKEIKELIQDSGAKVQAGAGLVNDSGSTLEEIVNSVKKVGDIIAEIAAASQEQSAGIEQVNKAVTQMDEMTQQNAALAEETSAASVSMREHAQQMQAHIDFFTA
jgi:methyl-accepting chemotaxis protein